MASPNEKPTMSDSIHIVLRGPDGNVKQEATQETTTPQGTKENA